MSDSQTIHTRQLNEKLKRISVGLDVAKNYLGDTFLDVGCGNGVAYRYLKPKGYVGIDFYEEELAKARSAHPEADFRRGDLYNLDGKYDFVLCSRLLIHFPDLEAGLKSLLSVTDKYCMVILKIGDESARMFYIPGLYWHFVFSEKRIRAFAPCDIFKISDYSAVLFDARK